MHKNNFILGKGGKTSPQKAGSKRSVSRWEGGIMGWAREKKTDIWRASMLKSSRDKEIIKTNLGQGMIVESREKCREENKNDPDSLDGETSRQGVTKKKGSRGSYLKKGSSQGGS